jgi:hypothetical protein
LNPDESEDIRPQTYNEVINQFLLEDSNLYEETKLYLKDFTKNYGKELEKYLKDSGQKYHFTSRVREYLSKNLAESSENINALTRNTISHMSLVRNAYLYIKDFDIKESEMSYFELYHYIMQRYLCDNTDFNLITLDEQKYITILKASLETFHSANHDVIKQLFIGFGYNLPRYKNLTIKQLYSEFDDGQD